jgi:hydroxysqualene dehydroxylase
MNMKSIKFFLPKKAVKMGKAVVIGGGCAGVAAATALAEEGIQVELLESRGFLGGRVYSITPSENFPASVDNGPHLLMGCYHETLRLFKRLEVPDPFHWLDPLSISWLAAGGKKVSLNCFPLPAPLHLALGLFSSNAFSLKEKLSLIRALSVFRKKPFALTPGFETLASFLDLTRQGPLARERFWKPLCNSVMNVPAEVAPLRGFGEAVHRIFFGTRRDSAMAVPTRPLSDLAFPAVEAFLRKKGGSVHFHEGVQLLNPGSSFGLKTRSGRGFTGDALIFAVPPSSLGMLWPREMWPSAESFLKMGKSPIVSVHLILEKPVMEGHFVGLSGARFEWVFNRNANWNWRGKGQYLSFTASAAEDLSRLKDPELIDLALREMKERCPAGQGIKILHAKVTREMAATFVWDKATDALRPVCQTPFPGIFLAGDWTDTGLPATIEGACFSGHRAAEKVKEYLRKTS